MPPPLNLQAGLADAVRALPGGLDAKVAEGGGNLSVGQRQVSCGVLRRACGLACLQCKHA